MKSVRVVAAVLRRGDELLVCQRPLSKRHAGLWEFPGGKCEAGESDTEALRRELREELGMELQDADAPLYESRDENSPFVIAFVPVTAVGEPQCFEHAAIQWGTIAELQHLPLAPTDLRFVLHLLGADPSRSA
jgi:mutator protein MutT